MYYQKQWCIPFLKQDETMTCIIPIHCVGCTRRHAHRHSSSCGCVCKIQSKTFFCCFISIASTINSINASSSSQLHRCMYNKQPVNDLNGLGSRGVASLHSGDIFLSPLTSYLCRVPTPSFPTSGKLLNRSTITIRQSAGKDLKISKET